MAQTLLLVEDEAMQRSMMTTLLEKKLGYQTLTAESGEEVWPLLQKHPEIRLILLDLNLPGMSGFHVMEQLQRQGVRTPVVILTGSNAVDEAVRAIKLGAADFITKPPQPERLQASIANALRIVSLTDEVARLKREKSGILRFEDLIGHDSGLKEAVRFGRRAAAADISVLISGETGVGKELLARAIHGESARSQRPFVAVNCGAIPENLVESTLFGHVKGAFTGAISDAPGKFREAEGGTLFLDEVGELPPSAQVKLLRVLQQQEVEPVGGPRAVAVNVRIISATNRNLQAEVKGGKFREDLFFRLNVLPIILPPLRQRPQDIALLAHHFIKQAAAQEAMPARALAEEARAMLEHYRWPGNVRELANAVRRAMVLSDHATLEMTDFQAIHPADMPPPMAGTAMASLLRDDGSIKPLGELEQEAMAFAVKRCNHNITKAAASLGMAKSTFYKKMQQGDE